MKDSREVVQLLKDLDEYLDGKVDINDHGGPNEPMRLQVRVREALTELDPKHVYCHVDPCHECMTREGWRREDPRI